jgi:hypothetical protein
MLTSERSEQTVNTKKNLALQDGERRLIPALNTVSISSDTTFGGYCPQKQVAVLRAAAGVPSFLNDVCPSARDMQPA